MNIRHLGVIDYAEALALQKALVEERLAGEPDVLLLLEHPHVITRGASARREGAPAVAAMLDGVPVYDVERGGQLTYHGPGQLVAYPIVHLKERGLGLAEHMRGLEDAVIEAVRPWAAAERLAGFTGVWSGGRKLASIGVAVRRWVSYHGVAVNVSTDLAFFRRIYPCGLEPSQMTSLEKLTGGPVPMGEVRERLASALLSRLAGRPAHA